MQWWVWTILARSSALILKDGYFTTVKFDLEPPKSFIVLKMDFEQDIYIRNNTSNTVQRLSQLLSFNNRDVYDFVVKSTGLVNIACSSPNFSVGEYWTAPPTSDPASSLFNILYKGIRLEESFFHNRYALVYTLPQLVPEIMKHMVCNVTFNSDGPISLSTEGLESISGIFSLIYETPRCELKNIEDTIELGAKIPYYARKVSIGKDLESVDTLIKSIAAREAYTGCKQWIKPWIQLRNITFNSTMDQSCRFRPGQPEWTIDPCCNSQLLNAQCCTPKNLTLITEIADEFNTTAIGTCNHPKRVAALLTSASKSIIDEFEEPFDF